VLGGSIRIVTSSASAERRAAGGAIERVCNGCARPSARLGDSLRARWVGRGAGALAGAAPPAFAGDCGDGGAGDGPMSSISTVRGGSLRSSDGARAMIAATSAIAPWTASEPASADLRATP
jgi:hypothetical protein